MKKRCTNSACRKTFTAAPVCPYCGKEYPRIRPQEHEVYLINWGRNKVKTIKALWTLTMTGLREAKDMVDQAPCVVGKGLTKEEALLWCKELSDIGASAKVR